jgi:endo-1,3(4)-beta-glucanase
VKKHLVIAAASVVAIAIVTSGALWFTYRHKGAEQESSALVDKATLASLPAKDNSSADISHVAPTIMPPTNSWISGMVLQKVPQPVFPMPLSFRALETGFEIGLPTISATPTVISGGHVAGMNAAISSAKHFQLTRYDKISATLTYKNEQGDALGQLTLAQGVPYVYYHSLANGELTLSDSVPLASADNSTHYLRFTKAGHDYVAVTNDTAQIATTGATSRIALSKDSLVTLYALPGGQTDSLRQYAGNELVSTATSHNQSGSNVTTTLRYETANHQPTVYAPMGYRAKDATPDALVTYDSIYGTMRAVAGNEFTTSVPTVAANDQLDMSHLSDQHKQALIQTLKQDAAATKITAQDSYYAGKQLARAANLLTLAVQLNQPDVANQLSATMKDAFAARLNGSYFYYDPKLKGVAATTKAFGSEDFNDHHFHYGYFIYAASILGQHDAAFLSAYKNKLNLLVADIASYNASTDFPAYRYYDAYAGHSWAAGLAPFADGNNQESSSEAMNAWNAVTLWGRLTHNTQLRDTGAWMLANESASAHAAWRQQPHDITAATNFTSPLTSLNFGGKRTYSTFFSDAPNAKLGIQLIPMNPFMTNMPDDTVAANRLVDTTITNDNFNVALGDYILMYLSQYDGQRALTQLSKQQDAFIDDGNSRTYLNAFVYSQTDK